ncbi:MAG: UPF0158 family protein [Candidatus Nanopelagicales bacterium]
MDRESIESAWRALTSSAARGDPVQAASAIAPGIQVGLLQSAAAAAVVALARPAGAAAVTPLIEALRVRSWAGDAELVELLAALSSNATTDRRRLPVDLDMLDEVLSSPEGGYLDLESGDVWPMSIVDDGQVEGIEGDTDDPDPRRWLVVAGDGGREAYQDMVDFAASVTEGRTRADLSAALDGRGAFRLFQAALDRHEANRVLWRVLSTERRAGRARAWLAEQGYDAKP